jgi:hypothetical protein
VRISQLNPISAGGIYPRASTHQQNSRVRQLHVAQLHLPEAGRGLQAPRTTSTHPARRRTASNAQHHSQQLHAPPGFSPAAPAQFTNAFSLAAPSHLLGNVASSRRRLHLSSLVAPPAHKVVRWARTRRASRTIVLSFLILVHPKNKKRKSIIHLQVKTCFQVLILLVLP